jgi:hypothetical protein
VFAGEAGGEPPFLHGRVLVAIGSIVGFDEIQAVSAFGDDPSRKT